MHRFLLVFILILFISSVHAYMRHGLQRHIGASYQQILRISSSATEWSSSEKRGEEHLSAQLEEGDVIMWQSGSWTVDGVVVGDGSPAYLQFGVVATVQLVWSHNCEHGVIHADPLVICTSNENLLIKAPSDDDEVAQIGPEQLLAILHQSQKNDGSYELKESCSELRRQAGIE